jgi:hypothetical protein
MASGLGPAFELEDIWTVVLPKEYAARLRSEFSAYAGQVVFAERE